MGNVLYNVGCTLKTCPWYMIVEEERFSETSVLTLYNITFYQPTLCIIQTCFIYHNLWGKKLISITLQIIWCPCLFKLMLCIPHGLDNQGSSVFNWIRQAIEARVSLPDGHQMLVEFDSASTCSEVSVDLFQLFLTFGKKYCKPTNKNNH